MGEIRVLNTKGDEKLEWDPADRASTAEAKKRFAALKEQGYEFYEVSESKGKRVERFNKNLSRLIAAPGAKTKADKVSGGRERAMAGGPTSRSDGSEIILAHEERLLSPAEHAR